MFLMPDHKWARLLAYVTGLVNQKLLLQNGHFGQHLRRMRELYGARLAALRDSVTRYLKGAVELPDIQAGLNSPAYLVNGMKSNAAAVRAAACGVEVLSIDRFVLRRRDIQGVLVGFAAFTDAEIRKAVIALAQAFEK